MFLLALFGTTLQLVCDIWFLLLSGCYKWFSIVELVTRKSSETVTKD
jgi:hypothetical protein